MGDVERDGVHGERTEVRSSNPLPSLTRPLAERTMAPRQIALLPEVELQDWAKTLLPPARGTLQRLRDDAREATRAGLEVLIDRHLLAVEEAQQHNEFIDLDRAKALAVHARALTRALDELAPTARIVAAAAVLYFVTSDDAEDDLASSVGFDDDTEVLESALKRVGL